MLRAWRTVRLHCGGDHDGGRGESRGGLQYHLLRPDQQDDGQGASKHALRHEEGRSDQNTGSWRSSGLGLNQL